MLFREVILQSMKPTRIVLADDHAVMRASIRRLLENAPDFEVVGEASNGVEAIHSVNSLAPDVLLLDMEMPVLSGVEVAKELHATHSPVRVLALSAYNDEEYINALRENGASGYLTKDTAWLNIVETIREVALGKKEWIRR
jgi:DNA-binding NarL/FixJ family response regulator